MADTIQTVKCGHVAIEVKRLACGRYRFEWHDDAGKRRRVTYKDRAKAVKQARERARLLHNRQAEVGAVSADEVEAFRRWRAENRSHGETPVGECVQAYLTAQAMAVNLSRRDLRDLTTELTNFAFEIGSGRRVGDLETAELDLYVVRRNGGARRRANVRASVVRLFNWLRDRGHLAPAVPHAADAMVKVAKPVPTIEVIEPDQLRAVLEQVKADYFPAFAIMAFAGLRSTELRAVREPLKRPLMWEDIDWERSHIEVAPNSAKQSRNRTGRRRFVPLSDNLKSWLAPYRTRTGPVCARRENPSAAGETARLARKALGLPKWPQNCLRHGYATARCAVTGNAAVVAREMGNSIAMVEQHYDNRKPREWGEAWFGLLPGDVERIKVAG